MKIGVIGPDTTVKVIKTVVERDIPDVQLAYACTEFFEESGKLASKFQNDGTVDAILFSGPTNYNYALRRTSPVMPWGYLPHSRTAALQALLTAQSLYGSDLKAISVDRYDPQLLRATLDACSIQDSVIYQAPYDPEDLDFEHKLLEFHRDCYRRKLVSACFTSMEHIQAPLLAEGIPCIRTYPADEVIREQIYHLQLRNFSARGALGKMAVIAIRFDYIFDDEKNLLTWEWEKMQYQNASQEQVHALAQQMEAAVFNISVGDFFVVTSRNMLMNMFLKNGEHSKLIQFGRRSPEYRVWVGIGMGNTMLEAKSRASMALNRSVADRAGNSYLLEDENHGLEKLDTGDIPPAELSTGYIARRIGVSTETLNRLYQALGQAGNTPITSEELASRMGITIRSANRIVALLEEAGYVTTVGKRSIGKGRPARVVKITLPDRLPGT